MSGRRKTSKNFDDSAVLVRNSPVASMKQKGNLTGNARMIRNHVLEMDVLIQEWNVQVLEGMTAVVEIKSIMLEKLNSKKAEIMPYVSMLEGHCKTLHNICLKMEKVVENMGELSMKILAVCKLEERNPSRKLMFLSWSVSRFGEVSQQIHKMYQRELIMKVTMKEEFCFCNEKDVLVFLEAAWLQEPYIDRQVIFSHGAMLSEVGYSPLSKTGWISSTFSQDK